MDDFNTSPLQLIGGESREKTELAIPALPNAEFEARRKSLQDLLAKLFPLAVELSSASKSEKEQNSKELLSSELNPSPLPCGIDYFSATGWVLDQSVPQVSETIQFLETHVVYSFWPGAKDFKDERSRPSVGYNQCLSWYGGRVKIQWHTEKIHQRAYFMASGSVLELLDAEDQYNLIALVVGCYGFRPTRIDVYVRDFEFKLLPAQLWEWAEQLWMTRFKSKNFSYVSSGPLGEFGATFYAGTRGKGGGETFFRCYDESKEPRSPVEAIKYECEFSGVKSQNLAQRLLSQPYSDEWFATFCSESSVGAGVIDFRQGDSKTSHADRPRVALWQDFVAGIRKIKIPGKVKKPEIDAFPTFAFAMQWGKKLAKVCFEDPKFRIQAFLDSISIVDCQLAQIIWVAIASGESRLNFPNSQKFATSTE